MSMYIIINDDAHWNSFLPFLDRGVLLTADVDTDEAHISKTKKEILVCKQQVSI